MNIKKNRFMISTLICFSHACHNFNGYDYAFDQKKKNGHGEFIKVCVGSVPVKSLFHASIHVPLIEIRTGAENVDDVVRKNILRF